MHDSAQLSPPPLLSSIPQLTAGVILDLDGTLAASKQRITDEVAAVLAALTAAVPVAVISGCAFAQFKAQLLPPLRAQPMFRHTRLTLLPTSGGTLYRYRGSDWAPVYDHSIPEHHFNAIVGALEQAVRNAAAEVRLGIPQETYGPQIEYRGSQVTFSALGQQAPLARKEAWDPPPHEKRAAIVRHLNARLPSQYQVSYGGTTSIDITTTGIDKGYGVCEYRRHVQPDVPLSALTFVGDRLEPGGNDFPARAAGVPALAVNDPHDTAAHIHAFLKNAANDCRYRTVPLLST